LCHANAIFNLPLQKEYIENSRNITGKTKMAIGSLHQKENHIKFTKKESD